MLEQANVDKVRSLGFAYLQALQTDLQQTGEEPRGESFVRTSGGWTALLVLVPAPPPGTPVPQELPGPVRDCLAALAEAPEPLSAVRVRRRLKTLKLTVWSIATVKRTLAHLHKVRQWVVNFATGRRGYALPGPGILFRRPPPDDTKADTGVVYACPVCGGRMRA
jgi:hypothetical protein